MPKRKASTLLTPPQSTPASIASITSSRRSSRAVPRKNYAHKELLDDPDVFEDPLDREASPDQTSELSEPPSEHDLSEPPSDLDVDHDEMSDDSLVKPVTSAVKRKKTSPAKSTGVDTPKASSPAKKQVKKEVIEDEEVEYDSDGEPIEKKGPTKASKYRERDARAAEKYLEFAERPPTVDSDYVPVPFKGRLGYACLNTILRSRKEPVFCSRTTRIATIAKEDKGMAFVYELGKQNAADLSKMLEWNEKYGIRFFRLSSEMFPFASHADYLYNLEHADGELRAAGAVANKYDHRVTCHPGQFTQIASPTPKIFDAAVRDLEFHNELLTRMRLQPEQRDRDAVLILHLGGAYGDKEATLQRFRTNYAKLSEPVKRRMVLENDDMSWNVTELLPLCQELNIPLVLDWHHHNILHDEERFREGTLDILTLLPAIAETWTRKGIKQKMHISEARLPNHPLASKRRSHSARVYHLPPCADDMDIMIEAKDKEQAVFELSKTYKLNNPPLPPEVVGDGPGAKGDEAYWPEGQELRLKVTKTRVKKEPEYDSEGNEIKPKPKPRPKRRVKQESESPTKEEEDEVEHEAKVEEEEEVPTTPKRTPVTRRKVAKKEADGTLSAVKDILPAKKRPARGKPVKHEPESDAELPTPPTSVEPKTSAASPKVAQPRTRGKKNAKHNVEESTTTTTEVTTDVTSPVAASTTRARTPRAQRSRRGNDSVAATETERQTGLTARQLVDRAYDHLEEERHPEALA